MSPKLLIMKILRFLVLGYCILLGLIACKKSTTEDIASADVFIQSIKNPIDTTQTLYAAVSSIFSYSSMTSVSVIDPNNSTKQLTNYANLGNSFYNDPVYSATLPSVGVYNYTVKFSDGQSKAYTNTLLAATLPPPVITSLGKNVANDSINITWKAVANAQAYQMKVTKGTGTSLTQVYYLAPFYDASTPLRPVLTMGVPLVTISAYGTGTYTFEIDAILYETSAYTFIQAVGISTQYFTY